LYQNSVSRAERQALAQDAQEVEQANRGDRPSQMMVLGRPEKARASDGWRQVPIEGFLIQRNIRGGEVACIAQLVVEQFLRAVVVRQRCFESAGEHRDPIISFAHGGEQGVEA